MSVRFEYKFLSLSLTQARLSHSDPAAGLPLMDKCHDQIGALGEQGWEAVGQVTISAYGYAYPFLLFKRPMN